MGELDWDKGIPLGLIGLVAVLGGPEMSVMRGVSKNWKTGYEESVKKIWIFSEGPAPTADFASRFPSLEILDIGSCPMPEAALSCISGLKHLSTLNLGSFPSIEGMGRGEHPMLAYVLSNASLEIVKGLPITSLDLSFCFRLSEKGLARLRGLKLARLELMGSRIRSLEPLRGLPLTYLGLYECRLLTG